MYANSATLFTMETQTSLLARHRKGLEDKFKCDYPNGRFIIQILDCRPPFCYDSCYDNKKLPALRVSEISLAWEPRCRISPAAAPLGICFLCLGNDLSQQADFQKEKGLGQRADSDYKIINGCLRMPYLNNTWGYVRYYNSLEEMLSMARKLGILNEQIEAFKECYLERKTQLDNRS